MQKLFSQQIRFKQDDGTAFTDWQEKKLDKAQALRQAMLTTIKNYSNPKDWAAFTLIGEAH